MEYISGGELFDHILEQENKVFSEKQAKKYMKQLLEALNHMHSQNVAHRDIKAENIMRTQDGQLKFIDFGLASEIKKGNLNHAVGTPSYMSPECLNGQPHNQKVDMWAMGVLLYVFLSGYMPF